VIPWLPQPGSPASPVWCRLSLALGLAHYSRPLMSTASSYVLEGIVPGATATGASGIVIYTIFEED
jgi:hypothetical protein